MSLRIFWTEHVSFVFDLGGKGENTTTSARFVILWIRRAFSCRGNVLVLGVVPGLPQGTHLPAKCFQGHCIRLHGRLVRKSRIFGQIAVFLPAGPVPLSEKTPYVVLPGFSTGSLLSQTFTINPGQRRSSSPRCEIPDLQR